jgi:hypothetical protein
MELLGLANLFVSAISAASAVVQAHSSRKVNTTDIIKAFLEVLTSKALKETQELINNIRSQNDPDIIQNHIAEANSRVCFYLKQIKKHNENELPTKRLEKLWSSHDCETCL